MAVSFPQGFSVYPELLTLPPRVKNLETSLSDNWKEHSNFKNTSNAFSKRLFDLQVGLNDLYFRVNSLEGRQVVPGGGGAGLSATQSQDLAWLHANRPNIVLTTDLGDIQTQILAFMDQKDYQDKLQQNIQSFISDPGSITRFALYNFNQIWWQNLDIKSKVDVKYLRSMLDLVYTDWTWMDQFKNTIYNGDPGLNTINKKVTDLQDKITSNVATITQKVDDAKKTVKDFVACVNNNIETIHTEIRAMMEDVMDVIDDMVFGGSDGIRCSQGDCRKNFRNAVNRHMDKVKTAIVNIKTCGTALTGKF